jgi:hypothetical protein
MLEGGYISGHLPHVCIWVCGTCMPHLSLGDHIVCIDTFVVSKPNNLTNTSATRKFRRRIAEPCTSIYCSLCSPDDNPPIDCVQGRPLYQQDGEYTLNNGAAFAPNVNNLLAPCPTGFQGPQNVDTAACMVSLWPMYMLYSLDQRGCIGRKCELLSVVSESSQAQLCLKVIWQLMGAAGLWVDSHLFWRPCVLAGN